MFEELCLEPLFICIPSSVHLPDCLLDVCVVEHVARGWGGGDQDRCNNVGAHGLRVDIGR
jgi:hypothetical protein